MQYSSASSKRVMSFLKVRLHFLHANAISVALARPWSDTSAWHSAHCETAEERERAAA